MGRKELVLQYLEDGYGCLFNALIDLKTVNAEEQFDYCTSPELSHLFDKVEDIVDQLGEIVDQK